MESQPPQQGSKKGRGHSKVRAEDLASLSVKVSALEEALLEMSSKVEKVESDVRTDERHPLDELESLKTSVDTLQNSEEEGTESRHSLEEHAEHLRAVFKTLREKELYVKKEKCSFVREEVHFLGHVIPHGTLRMDEKKVQAIKEWEPPTCVAELRSFLGLVNYYRPSIKGYSARAAPLTNLLKKNKPWSWTEECQKAFDDLKAVVIEEPLLALPDFSKPFEVHTYAYDFVRYGVLMQDRHPVAFESPKLNHTERRYTAGISFFFLSKKLLLTKGFLKSRM